jgi:hypothetical protein
MLTRDYLVKANKTKIYRKLFHFLFSTHLASSAKAKTPAASGAAADVPECVVVHLPYKSVVA